MLNLENKIELNEATIKAPNLCKYFSDEDLTTLGEHCFAGYQLDEESRREWLERNETGMDLALQITKEKTLPWPGCSNVAFPLVTIAALQFHAMAYPALLSGKELVKCEVTGPDPDGSKQARSQRIATHMSWQLLRQDSSWEEQEDKAILNVSIVGTTFKKSRFSSAKKHNVSELVLAKDLAVNYWAKSLEDAPRKTHIIPLYRNEVREHVLSDTFRDILEESWFATDSQPASPDYRAAQDARQGVKAPSQATSDAPFIFLEQHCNLDLDQDGYEEPYIVTVEKNSQTVVRIVTRFDSTEAIERVVGGKYNGKILRIKATEFFTKKSFIPSPDGGFYDMGFGVFLGPLNETTNSLINMLVDNGTLQTTGGGFIGRGAKLRSGTHSFSPFEWKRVESSGDDLRKQLVPLQVNEPSPVLFQLLGLLIDYTNRIAGTTDTMVGENPGQNTPAETMRTMVEMGQRIYTAIFKRLWRSSRDEYQKLYELNAVYLEVGKTFVGGATLEDYNESSDDLYPVADPNVTSDSMRYAQARALQEAAQTAPGYNMDEVQRRYLRALKIENIDAIFPGTEGQAPAKDPKLIIAETKIEGDLRSKEMELQARQQEFIITLMEERRVNNAKIIELLAKAENEAASAQTEAQYAQVALINAQVAAARAESEHLNRQIEHMLKAMEIRNTKQESGNGK